MKGVHIKHMRPESGYIHNFRHNEHHTLHPGEDVCDKRWRHSAALR